MLKQLAKQLAKVIAPLVFKELVIMLEKITEIDINQDGNIGE